MSGTEADGRIRELEADNARLRFLLDQRGVPELLRHQIRNTLATMRAILRRSATLNQTVDDYVAHVSARFDAVLRVQSLIQSGSAWVDLQTLIANEFVAHLIREGERATVEGPHVHLDAKTAELLGLAFHELVTNAIKFGALTRPEGRITVRWSLEEEPAPTLVLTWEETGSSGPATTTPVPGFGMEVLGDMLRYQLKCTSTVAFHRHGLHWTIRCPLPRVPAAA